MPLAVKVVQLQTNLGAHAQRETILSDRRDLDGADLWQMNHKGIRFVIVGKSTMLVVQDAQGIAKGERARVQERVVTHGQGKTAREERVRTEWVGIEALTRYDSYGDAEYTQQAHRRDYLGQPITAVVVRRWDNRVPKGGGTVSLATGDVGDPVALPQTHGGWGERACVLSLAGHGAVYRFSVVADPGCCHAHRGERGGAHLALDSVWN